jgi:outer membrane protein assembly factor BamB
VLAVLESLAKAKGLRAMMNLSSAMRLTVLTAFMTIITLIGGVRAGAADWPQYGFGPAHNGFNPDESTISAANVSQLHQVWRTPDLDDQQQSQPIVAGNRLFVNTGSNGTLNLNVFNATTGARLWMADSGEFSTSTPAVAGSLVYVGDSVGGGLFAYDAGGCGSSFCFPPVWQSAERTGASSGDSPVVAGGLVFFAMSDGRISAWAAGGCGAASCPRLWSGTIGGGSAAGTPAVANGRVYIAAASKLWVYAAAGCGMTSCAPLWTGPLPTVGAWTPIVYSGAVYVAVGYKLLAFDAAGCGSSTCPALWTGSVGARVGTPPVARRGQVYVGAGDILTDAGSRLAAFAAGGCGEATCKLAWIGRVARPVRGSIALANGLIYAPTYDGHLRVFRIGGCGNFRCRPLASVHVGAGGNSDNVTVVNGTVYAGTNDGHVVSLRP